MTGKPFAVSLGERATEKCEEPDSNRRTPAGMDPKSIAFDLARRSSPNMSFVFLRVYVKFLI